MKSSTLVCLLALVAVAITAPQFPILSPIGSPFLPVQPGSQDEFGRLIPGGFVHSSQGNRPNGSWPMLMNPMPYYPIDPRFIIYLGTIFSVSTGDSNPIKEIEPVAPIVPPAEVVDTPTVAAISRCSEDEFDYPSKSNTSIPYKYMVESDITSKNQYPFMVALVVFDNTIWKYKLSCGGSLISSTKILTAAHCVTEPKSTNVIDASRLKVKFGIHFLSITENDAQLSRKVQQIKIHEEYDPVKIYNDIAILTLSSPVEYSTDTISPVCLVPECFDDDGNRQAIAMGWGHTQSGGLNSDYLRHAFLSTVPFSKCQKKYGDKIDEDKMLCAFKKGQDTCQNDSGGPLVMEFPDDSSCRFMQIGIVSFGKGCAFKNYPGVYVRIKNYLPWIEENTN